MLFLQVDTHSYLFHSSLKINSSKQRQDIMFVLLIRMSSEHQQASQLEFAAYLQLHCS